MTGDLIAFVRRCLDEQVALLDQLEFIGEQIYPLYDEQLADVAAKRRILDRIESLYRTPGLPDTAAATRWSILMNEYELRILPDLAQPYAGREEWRT